MNEINSEKCVCGLLIKNLNAHNLQLHRQHCGQFKNVNKISTISNFKKTN